MQSPAAKTPPQSHVICTPTAAAVIKTYSPNLMVHPLMRSSPSSITESVTSSSAETDPSQVAARIIALLDRLHVLVVGPGLGRDPLMQETCARVIRAARDKGLPMVLDADALLLVQKDPDLVRGYGLAVLTPNVVEFGRLTKALGVDDQVRSAAEEAGESAKVEALARALGGVMVVQKGAKDRLSDGRTTLTVDLEGGKKRSGGQGDTLTGSIATFLGWRKAYLDGIWETGGALKEEELVGLAVFGGSAVTRVCPSFPSPFLPNFNYPFTRRRPALSQDRACFVCLGPGKAIRKEDEAGSKAPYLTFISANTLNPQECSRLAFEKKGRSLQASDLTDEVHTSFMNLFREVDDEAGGGARL